MKVLKVVFLICFIFAFNLIAQDTKDKSSKGENKSLPTQRVLKADKKNDNEVFKIVNSNQIESNDPSLIPFSNQTKRNNKYKIGFQDVLTITVYRHPELSQTVSVGQDGSILLPRINEPIIAVCKTERELANLVTKLYKNYLRNPFVNVRTQEQRSQPFAVIGAVNKPGNFFLNQKIRLLSLISLAGGQDVEKSGSRVQVARIGNASACSPSDDADSNIQFYAYALNDVLSGKENPWMQPGDIVSILEAEEAYVIGEVFKPAKITLKEPITLSEALAYAGGVSSTAKISRVVIQRKEKNNPVRKELVFNMKDIRANKIADPQIQANDIVMVSSSTSKKVKKGLTELLVNGLPNIFFRFPF